MLAVFTTLTPAYHVASELQLALRLLRKALPADAQLYEISRAPEQAPGVALQQALRAHFDKLEVPEFVLLIYEPWLFISQACIDGLRQVLAHHTQVDCVLPADERGSLATPNYFTRRQFELFSRDLAARPQTLQPYDGRPPFVMLLRSAALPPATWPEDLFLLPGQLELQRCVVNMNAFAHRTVDFYGEERTEVLALLPPSVENLLDIGCSTGQFGRLLKSTRACRVTGIEINPFAAAQARRHLDTVRQADALNVEMATRFDCVTCLDSLEHIVDTHRLLTRIRQDFLNPGGYCLVCAPNVGHWSLIEDLLAGRWDYVPNGLMCSTHVRFFTRHSLRELFHDHGFEIIQESTLHTPMPTRFKRAVYALLENGVEIDLSNIEIHSHYLLARLPA